LEELVEKNVIQEEHAQQNVLSENQIRNNVLVQDQIQKKARPHQQKCQARIWVEKELARSLPSQFGPYPTNLDMSINSIRRRSSAIVQFMATKLTSCLVLHTHQAILE
jgi:hypothetical protein